MNIGQSFPHFKDSDGSSLNAGYLYFGVTDLNPETNPIAVYWDDAFTIPAAQPIRTLNGYIVRDGVIANLYAQSEYSLTVKNKNEILLYSLPNSSKFNPIFVDTSDIVFTQTGTGAVERTLDSKLKEMFSAGDFNPAKDGVTDDSTELQNALTAAGGDTILIPPGTYKVNATLSVPANTIVYAYGVTFDFSAAHRKGFDFVDGGAIYGATLTGAGNSSYNANGIAVNCDGTNNSPSAPTFVNGPIVKDCVISGWGAYGVFLSYVNGGNINANKFANIGYAAVGGVSCNDTLVDGNRIDGVTPGTVGGDAYGIFIDRNDGTSETAEPRSYRCKIRGNTVKNVAASGGNNGQGIDTHGGIDFHISDNVVDSCEVGIFVTSSSISGTPTLAPKRCTVIGNSITGAKIGYGIMVSGAISGSTINEYAEGIVVQGNSINGHGISADGTSGAIMVQGSKGTIVADNCIRNSACNGIYINFGNIAFNVEGNTIIDPHDLTFTTPACILVAGDDNRGYIGGNTFRYESAALGTYVAVRSVSVASGKTGLDLEINRCSFVGIDSTHLSYNEGTSTGVNAANLLVQRGRAQVSLTNAASNNVTVTFGKRFPVATPRIFLTRNGTPVPGTVAKSAQIESNTIAADSFLIVARPYDLTTFGGAGTLEVDWIASV